MRYSFVFFALALFFLGYGVHDLMYEPLPTLPIIPADEVTFSDRVREIASGGPTEQPGPRDRVEEDSIVVLPDRVIMNVENTVWSTFTDTNSMDPVIDQGANAIQIVPQSSEEIQVGDIISYESKFVDGFIIHRVVEIGEDEDGWYARAKGDNNRNVDPEKIRFDSIRRVVIAIVY